MMFFIGKHFGTGAYIETFTSQRIQLNDPIHDVLGVILSTAFVHMLQDAFMTLLKLDSPIKDWVGLLV